MISTVSNFLEKWLMQRGLIFLAIFPMLLLFSCTDQPQQTSGARPNGFPAQPRREEPSASSPADTSTPAPKEEKKEEKEAPFFGSTYWDETLTSVYYYPKQVNDDMAETHLKFGHREDDIWLCGDQRKNFEPGTRYRLVVTFEPNAPCITNWKLK